MALAAATLRLHLMPDELPVPYDHWAWSKLADRAVIRPALKLTEDRWDRLISQQGMQPSQHRGSYHLAEIWNALHRKKRKDAETRRAIKILREIVLAVADGARLKER